MNMMRTGMTMSDDTTARTDAITGEILDGALQQDMTAEITEFGTQFRQTWSQAVEGILRSGAVLAQAKDALAHGAWERFVEQELPIGSRTARRLIAIHRSKNINDLRLNRTHGSDLPPSWRTLYDLAVLPKDDFHGLLAAGQITPEMRRTDIKRAVAALSRPDTRAELSEVVAVQPKDGYGAILADPPWRFETRGRGGDRMADHHYPTLSFEDICALPVADLAAPDCALFLWITTEQLMRGQDVMASWGFAYKTVAFVWRKTSGPMGLGYWTRKQTELCLLGVRGQPRRMGADVEDIIEAPRAGHSAKPEEQYARIERLVAGPYVELFARDARRGWDAWGNELDAGSNPTGVPDGTAGSKPQGDRP